MVKVYDTITILFMFFFLLFWLSKLQSIHSSCQSGAFLKPLVLFAVAIATIFLLFILSFLKLRRLRLKNSRCYFLTLEFRFFISKIFLGPKHSFFKLMSTFLKVVLIGISGLYMRLESHFSLNIFSFFD